VLRALDQAEVRAAWIQGTGSLEAAELSLFDQLGKAYGRARRIDGPSDILSLTGNVSNHEGAGFLRMSATLAREGELGLEVFGGELVWGRAYAVELYVVVFDDIALARAYDERTGLALLTPQARSDSARPLANPSEAPRAASGHPYAVSAPTTPPGPTAGSSSEALPPGPALPARPAKPKEDVDIYPEVGDLVNHFHFGECSIMSSDGDRIRLRQERDGRVREVSLTMLRIEPPTIDPESGKRHFRLARKH
jgi:predicted DNA-binding protein with PD1-like motif